MAQPGDALTELARPGAGAGPCSASTWEAGAVPERSRAELYVVAGCLFEIGLPASDAGWRRVDADRGATLLGQRTEAGGHRIRFRAEAAAARRGEVALRFATTDGAGVAEVTVRVAPEREPEA